MRQLRIEAAKAESFAKPRAAALMRSLARVLPEAGALFDILETWPGDLASDGVIFRLNAGLHALALDAPGSVLGALYASGPIPPPPLLDQALMRALAERSGELAGWLAHPTQTNEVARVAGLVAVLAAMNAREAMPCEVLELGASAGLNLNFPHYAVRLGGFACCAAGSMVTVAPEWCGTPFAGRPLAVTDTRGVDLHPLDVSCARDRRSLAAYVWPGESARAERLAAAIALAEARPPQVATGRASDWLAGELAAPQPESVRRVVFHSMVMQYADANERAAIDAQLAAAGARANPQRPLVRVGLEWREDRQVVELTVTAWDGSAASGEPRLAAHCHPYGEWIAWSGLA